MKTENTALERTHRPSRHRTRPSAEPSSAEGVPVSAEGDQAAPTRRRFKEVWLVEDRREGKSIWTRVGVAFENTDGSWNIRLSALPVGGGRLNMRDPLPATERADRGERAERAERVAA
jgi:hypothetical protein